MSGVRQRSHRQEVTSSQMINKSNSMMRGTRMFRGGIFMDLALLAVFIILAYVFIARRSTISTADNVLGEARVAPAGSSDGGSQHLIDARMKKSPDFRNSECKNKRYTVTEPVTIVTVFFDYSFHDLKTTISSILHHTPMELVREILVIDDGSSLEYIVDKSKEYVKQIDKARLIRNNHQLSVSKARMVGFKEAKAEFVVFLDTNVVVAKGWLEPLVDTLSVKRSTIAVPHYDSINDPVSYEYRGTMDSMTASMSWSLAVRMTKSADAPGDPTATLNSPALRGNAMAVRKDHFVALGGYDELLAEGGGQDLELSLRAWLCGSEVLIVPCSRVGVVNLQDPIKIMSHANIRHIAELWFAERKKLVFRNTGIPEEMSHTEQNGFQTRRDQLSSLNLECKDIEWFFQNIAGNVPTPSEQSVHFGMIKCRTGRCMRIGDDHRLDLGKCSAEYYKVTQSRMMFEYTEDGLLISGAQCLTVQQTAYVVAEECRPGDTKQKWLYKDAKIQNEWSRYCLMHVTDPDPATNGKRQIAMAQECQSANDEQFATYDFVTQ